MAETARTESRFPTTMSRAGSVTDVTARLGAGCADALAGASRARRVSPAPGRSAAGRHWRRRRELRLVDGEQAERQEDGEKDAFFGGHCCRL